jgi:hypothetical protein
VRLDDGQREKCRRLRAEGWSIRALAAEFGVADSAIVRLTWDVRPKVVYGLDGRLFPELRARPMKPCVWCGNPHRGPREYCSARCRRQRRRYRAYVGHCHQS